MTKPLNKRLRRAVTPAKRALGAFICGVSGVATVELAFIAIFLSSIIVAVVDFGTAASRQMALSNAVRAGTQYALIRRPVGGDVTPIEQAVQDAALDPPPAPLTRNLAVAEVCACPGNAPGTVDCTTGTCGGGTMQGYVQISLDEDFEMMFDWPFINNPIRLGDSGLVRIR